MNQEHEREPPVIVEIPPPPLTQAQSAFFVGLGLVHLTIAIAYVAGYRHSKDIELGAPLWQPLCLFVGLSMASFAGWRLQQREVKKRRETWFREQQQLRHREVIDAVDSIWTSNLRQRWQKIGNRVVAMLRPSALQAVLLRRGKINLPPFGDHRFPLEIVSPFESAISARKLFLVFALLAGLGLLHRVGLFPQIPFFAEIIGPLGIMAAVVLGCAGLLLLLDVFRRSPYVRVAPGHIEVVLISPILRRLVRRSYPMEYGTVVVLCESVDTGRAARDLAYAILIRNGHRDRIAFPFTSAGRERSRLFLAAIMTSAPTPPLPVDMLVG
jgi:hypothetical protein